MKKILFISHDAHLAGAQILLLNLLKWLKETHPVLQFDVLLAGEGILTCEFQKIATVLKVPMVGKKVNVFERVIHQYKLKKFFKKVQDQKYDLVYNNTFSNGNLLCDLKTDNLPVITHVHELDYWIKRNGAENQKKIVSATDFYLTASKSVTNYLIENHICTETNVETVYEWIDSDFLLHKNSTNSIKDFLNLSEDSFIIAASGRESFRKGKDWFIPIAVEVLTKMKNKSIHFVWIGGHNTEELQYDCLKSGFQNNIHFIEHIANANSYFNEFEIFLMLSREDPFPLVNLETAIWNVPVICFENTGGTEELVEDNCGIKVPYGNLNMFSDAIIKLIESDKERKVMGDTIRRKVLKEYDINIVGEKIVNAILKVIKKHE